MREEGFDVGGITPLSHSVTHREPAVLRPGQAFHAYFAASITKEMPRFPLPDSTFMTDKPLASSAVDPGSGQQPGQARGAPLPWSCTS